MITIDDLMRSCGGGAPVPGGDGQQATSRRQMVETGSDHQLTVSRIRTAVSLLGRRTGHARFRRGPVAVAEQYPSSDHLQRPSASAAAGVTLGFVKGFDEAEFSGSASGASSSLPSTTLTNLTAGEGSVSNGRLPPVSGHHVAGKLQPPATSIQQQPVVSDYYTTIAAPRSKCHDRGLSENDAGGKQAHAGRCHCSKKRYGHTTSFLHWQLNVS